ncbi:ATP-binding protein [Campylobacter lanienae]|uniref:ATP-binding protein n=1 Tax=Campylobacter lanienae TaxID=75658 RepID=UPI002342DB47|nr:ATP-binding protein [Campylobacter lanienae]
MKNLKDCVELSIKDSGIGIEPSSQERIFERFYCANKSYSKKVGGTGLGLSIVKSVLNMHHAKVKLKSQKDIGSEFIIIFQKS